MGKGVLLLSTLKDKLNIPDSYTAIDIVLHCFQYLFFGILWAYAYIVVVVGVVVFFGSLLYSFIYLPLAWAVGHFVRLLS